jgi:hypothetical protein
LSVTIERDPFANQVGVDAMAQGDAGNRDIRLQAFLDDLRLEELGISGALAHGDPGDKDDGVHVKWTPSSLMLGF